MKKNALFFALLGLFIIVNIPATSFGGNVGWHGPIDYVFPVAGVNPKFENQKILDSYGPGHKSIEEIKDLLPAAFYDVISQPEKYGKYVVNVCPPIIKWEGELWKKYQEYTEKYKGTVKLEKNGDDLRNYKAGCPFPDPKNGIELVWDYVYRFRADDRTMQFVNIITDKDGHVRMNCGDNCILYYEGRLAVAPEPLLPNPEGLERMESFGYFEPYDLRGTVPLTYRYKDPDKADDMWMYIPMMRRVRRMSTAQRQDRVPGGSDLTWDIFEFFSGKVGHYTWKMLGRKELLCARGSIIPVWEEGSKHINPNGFFQKRNTYVLECTPKDPNHVYSKLVYYIDPDLYYGYYGEIYDSKGKLWLMVFYSQSADANWIPEPVMVYIDVQRNHSSSYAINGGLYNSGLTRNDFNMETLVKKYMGR